MIKEVARFIASKTSFIIGSTLQTGHRTQDAPDRCVCVLETAGGSVYPDAMDRVDLHIQVLARGKTYFNAHDDAWEVYDGIFRNFKAYAAAGFTLPVVVTGVKYWVSTITPLACPQYIGQDEHGRYEFSVNFVFRIKDLDT